MDHHTYKQNRRIARYVRQRLKIVFCDRTYIIFHTIHRTFRENEKSLAGFVKKIAISKQ